MGATTLFTGPSVTVTKTLGRGPVTVAQQPSAANGYTLIVQFNDDAPPGPDNYQVILHGVDTSIWPQPDIRVSQVAVMWSSETNRVYQVQYSTNVDATTWIDLQGTVQGTGGTNILYDSILGQERRFYRVIPMP